MESERLRVNSKRSMTTSVDADSDCDSERCVDTDSGCGSESIDYWQRILTLSKSKPIPAKRQKTRRWCRSAQYSTKYKKYLEKCEVLEHCGLWLSQLVQYIVDPGHIG